MRGQCDENWAVAARLARAGLARGHRIKLSVPNGNRFDSWTVHHMIHVVSTGFDAPTKARCLGSVAAQEGMDRQFRHHYVEASDQNPPLSSYENAWSVIRDLPPEDVVCLLDGDDWLAHQRVLEHVAKLHSTGLWVTYGSFVYSDGRPGFADPWQGRQGPWTATHLKTFRAGLFQRVRHEEHNGFHEHAWDIKVMVPMLEMAGADRSQFCPEVLYVYNYGSSYERKAPPERLVKLRAAAEWVKTQAPYARLEAL